jgi:simple sugar transport system permease protein
MEGTSTMSSSRAVATVTKNESTGHWSRLRDLVLQPEMAAVGALVALTIVFSLTSDGLMTQRSTWTSIASLTADLGVIAIFVSMLMISGHFDLSVGSVMGLSSYIGATLILDYQLNPVLGVALTLVVAGAIGLVNGLIVVYTGLHSFVVTLGMLMVARGVLNIVSGGTPRRITLPEGFSDVIAGSGLFGFRMSVLWLLLAAVIGHLLLNHTRFGNWTYAIGDSPSAAKDLGVPVARTTVKLFILSATAAGAAGVIQMSRFSSVDATRGTGVELLVVAAVVIGGTSLLGGFGSVIGAVLGALLFGTIQVGLLLSGVPGMWFNLAVGVLLILAVFLNSKLVSVMKSSGGRARLSTTEPEEITTEKASS